MASQLLHNAVTNQTPAGHMLIDFELINKLKLSRQAILRLVPQNYSSRQCHFFHLTTQQRIHTCHSMAPHPALTTPDIIRELLEQLCRVTALYPRTRRRNLFSTAQVCKAFATPSLNLLWGEMDSLMPLLRLIPDVIDIIDKSSDQIVRFQTNSATSSLNSSFHKAVDGQTG